MAYETESPLINGTSNNSTDTANTLTSGVYTTAALSSAADLDFFKITTAGASLITLNFDTSVSSAQKHWQIRLLDSNGDYLQTLTTTTSGTPLVSGSSQTGSSLIVDGFTVLPTAGTGTRFTFKTDSADTTIYTVTGVQGTTSETTLSLDKSISSAPADNTALQFDPTQLLTGTTTSLSAPVSAAGTYYIQVLADGAVWDSSDYKITATVLATTETSTENDTKEDAAANGNRLLANVPMTGALSSATDVDYWVFSTAAASDFTVSFASSAAGSSNEWKIDVTEWSGAALPSNAGVLTAGSSASVSVDDAVYPTAKTWVVKVSATSPTVYNTGNYTLKVAGTNLDLNDTPILTMGAASSSANSTVISASGVTKSIAVGADSTGILLTDLFDVSDADTTQTISSYNYAIETGSATPTFGAYIRTGTEGAYTNHVLSLVSGQYQIFGTLTASQMATARFFPGEQTGNLTFKLQAVDSSGALDGSGSSGWLSETLKLTSSAVGITVTAPANTTLTENASPTQGVPHSTTFTVKLNTQPSADVKVYLLDSNNQLDLSSALTFTTSNWNTPQTVTVEATTDGTVEGATQPAPLAFQVVSTDTDYDGFVVTPKSFTVEDNATPSLTTPTGLSVSDTAGVDTVAAVNSVTSLSATDANGDTPVYGITGGTVSSGSSTKAGTYGTLTVNTSTGAYSYTPTSSNVLNALSATVTDVFTVTASDGSSSDSKTLTVTLNGVNDTPVIQDATSITLTDTVATDTFSNSIGTLSAADADTGQTLSYGIGGSGVVTGGSTVISSVTYDVSKVGSYGTLYVVSAGADKGKYVFVPNNSAVNALNASTSETFTVTATDNASSPLTGSASLTVNIAAVTDTFTLSVTPSVPATYTDTSANDTFTTVATGTLTPEGATSPTYGITDGTVSNGFSTKASTYGTLSVNTTTGAYTYTPIDAGMEGATGAVTDSFTVTMTEGQSTASATFSATITGANDTPALATPSAASYTDTAADNTFTTNTGTLAGTDRDAGQTLVYGITGGTVGSTTVTKTGTYGTLTVTKSSGAYSFAPNDAAIEGLKTSTSETFTVTVTDGVIGSPVEATFTVNITGANDPLTLATPTALTYTDTAGSDVFNAATGTLAASDRDVETLIYGITDGTDNGTTVTKTGTYGALVVTKATGAYTFTPNSSAIEALSTGSTPSETFVVTVTTASSDSATANLVVNLTGANDSLALTTPTAASYTDTSADDTFSVNSGTLSMAEGSIAATGYGISGGTDDGTTVTKVGTYGTLVVTKATGAYTFTPNDSALEGRTASTTESFTVTATDGSNTASASYVVNVTAANDAPVLAAPSAMTAYVDTSNDDIFPSRTGTLSGSDRDSSATLTYGITGGTDNGTTVSKVGTYGTLTVTKATGAYSFAPNDSAIEALKTSASEDFTVTVSDGSLSDSKTLSMSVSSAANDGLSALSAVTALTYTDTSADDTFTTGTGTLSATDRDDTVTYGITDGTDNGATVSKVGTYGTLTVTKATGAYSFAPNDSAIEARTTNTSESFTVKAIAGGSEVTTTLAVNITGAADAPVLATPSAVTAYEDTTADDTFTTRTGTLSGSDRDSSATLTYGITGGTDNGATVSKVGTYGTLVVTKADGGYTFTPVDSAIEALKSSATDDFTVTVSDGSLSDSKTLSIGINATNDAIPALSKPSAISYTDTDQNDTFNNATGTLALSAADRDDATVTYGISGTVTDGGATVSQVGTYGTLTVTKATGAYTFVPNDSALEALSTNTSSSFTVTATAGGETSSNTLDISITAVAEAGTTVNVLAYDWKGHNVLNANVGLNGDAAEALGTTAAGKSFEGISGSEATLSAALTADANANNAVNLQDAISILKMIVGLEVNGAGKALSPYQAYAADYDGSGEVTLNDAIGVLKHVVGLDAPDPTWIFFNEMDTRIPSKATTATTTDSLTVPALTQNISTDASVGLVGVLRGDVDGSWTPAVATADLDTASPSYFTNLVAAYNADTNVADITAAQWGIYS